MTQKQTNILKWGILILGLILFLYAVIIDRFEISMIFAFSAILSWLSISYAYDEFRNYKQIGNLLIISGVIIGTSLFLNFGVEQIAIPKGGFVFNSDGIWKSLSIVFLSFIAGMLFHYLKDILPEQIEPKAAPEPIDPLIGSDWEFASAEDFNSDDYELVED